MNTRNIVEFTLLITKHNPSIETRQLTNLITYASELHKLYERQCNGYYSTHAEKRDLTREEHILHGVRDIANAIGCNFYNNRDPRGLPIYLYFPDMIGYNDILSDGGWHGIGVPIR